MIVVVVAKPKYDKLMKIIPSIAMTYLFDSFVFVRNLPLISSNITLTTRYTLYVEAATSIFPPAMLLAAKIAYIGVTRFHADQMNASEAIKDLTTELT